MYRLQSSQSPGLHTTYTHAYTHRGFPEISSVDLTSKPFNVKKQFLIHPFPHETWTTKHKHQFFYHHGWILDFYPCENPPEVYGEISLNRETCATPQVLHLLSSHNSKEITRRKTEKFICDTLYFCWIFSLIDFMLRDLSVTWKYAEGEFFDAVSQLQDEL